jgi:hypothetical protein
MNERMMAIRAPDGSRSGLVAAAEVGGSYLGCPRWVVRVVGAGVEPMAGLWRVSD